MNRTKKSQPTLKIYFRDLAMTMVVGIYFMGCAGSHQDNVNQDVSCVAGQVAGCVQGSSGGQQPPGDNQPAGQGTAGQFLPGAMPDGAWARSVVAGSSDSFFQGNAVDGEGNVFAVGFIIGTGSFSFAPGVTVTGSSSARNALIVKYDAAGNALWARVATSGPNWSAFDRVKTDAAGNVYAVGYQYGTVAFTYGPGVTATGATNFDNPILVKYDSAGNAIWAKSVAVMNGTPASGSAYKDLVVDMNGAIIVAGYAGGKATYDLGNGATATTPNIAGPHGVIVKYNSAGAAQWGQTVLGASNPSRFNGVTMDSWGNIYGVGFQQGATVVNYTASVFATGSHGGLNTVIVKFNPNGVAQWARTAVSAPLASEFLAVAVDNKDSLYAVGYQTGGGTFTYAPGVNAIAPYVLGQNALLVKYSTSGVAQWAKVPTVAPDSSIFTAVAIASYNDSPLIYVAGEQRGGFTFNYGSSTATGAVASVPNAVISRFDETGNAGWAKSTTSSSLPSHFGGVAVSSVGNLIACGFQAGTTLVYYTLPLSTQGTHGGAQNATLVRYY